MKTTKKIKTRWECYTVEEFISYYNGAGRRELKACLKNLKHPIGIAQRNEKDAIIALLA